ncbi:MAG TPA: hypothetical protein VIX86_18275, partial [Streptosporangiaceae bacterium]
PGRPRLGRPGLGRQAARGTEPEMMTRRQLPGAMTWGVLAIMVAGVVTGAAACGTVIAGSGGQPSPASSSSPIPPGANSPAPTPAGSSSVAASAVPLCANISHLSTLVVSLTGVLERSRMPAVLPVGYTFRDPARVQAVASALCALPPTTGLPVNCPADFGGSYRLVFGGAGQSYPAVLVKVSGCRTVSGLGPVRTTSTAFWATLTRELGTRHTMPPMPPVMP